MLCRRVANRRELEAEITVLTKSKPQQEWIALLTGVKIWHEMKRITPFGGG
jgi:crotonobetainyl-CoA:carnitine CoA-transferase CaiB-like acyl-CoA transferase